MKRPLISVLLPAYNAEKTIKEAIDSIVSQTYNNWELIAVDDGSTDSTPIIIQAYNDSRIKYFCNNQNLGLIKTLNRGIELCKGKYIARMDSDDISSPDRFEKQVSYMEKHCETIICGSVIRAFGVKGEKKINRIVKYLEHDKDIKKSLVYSCCFAHPSVMIRSNIFEKSSIRYNENYPYAEDYKLWIDLMDYGEYHNLQEVLLNYRLSDSQMTQVDKYSHPAVIQCRWEYLSNSMGKKFVDALKINGIDEKTLDEVPRNLDSKYILLTLYLSLKKYTIYTIAYFLFKKDYRVLGLRFMKRIVSRIIIRKKPLLYA